MSNVEIIEKIPITPKGIVERRLYNRTKLFYALKDRHVRFYKELDYYSFRAICVRGAKYLGNEAFAELLDSCAKPMFAENKVWHWIKKHFNLDLQLPFITGFWTTNAIVRPNLVVNTGHKRYADQIGGTATTPMTALAIGTSSTAPAATDTTLGAEITTNGCARGAATVSNTTTTTTGDTEQWQKTWNVTGTEAITEEGIFDNNTSGGTMLAHNTFSTVNVGNGDTFQITHKIQS